MNGSDPIPVRPGPYENMVGLYEETNGRWCTEGAGANYVDVKGGTTYYLTVYGTRNSYEIYYGEDIEKGLPKVIITKVQDGTESYANVKIISEVDLNLSRCYYGFDRDWYSEDSTTPQNDEEWEKNVYGNYSISEMEFNAEFYSWPTRIYIRLEDVNGNILFYKGDFAFYSYSGNPACFIAGTKVSTPSGYKNIEEIQIGDMVYSMNLQTMQREEKVVERLKITENACKITYLISVGEAYIESTPDHKFYVKDRGWKDACELEVGDILIDEKGNDKAITDIQIKIYDEPVTVYNFEVEDNRNYFVGEDNILVYTIPDN